MKISLKLQDDDQRHQNPLLKAKIPVSIFNQPFTSALSTAAVSSKPNSSSDLSFSLSTNFHSGPSLKLSYSPTTTTTSPFSLSLKSGIGLFGSPLASPLIFSANFSLSPMNPAVVIPSFSLHFKPQLGNFSLCKTTSSNPTFGHVHGSEPVDGANSLSGSVSNVEIGNGFLQTEGPLGWQELKLESIGEKGFLEANGSLSDENKERGGFNSGVSVIARTVLPVTKRVFVNLRWGVNAPLNFSRMPCLILNKIGIERVEEDKEKPTEKDNGMGDFDLLKRMCFGMRKDLEVLEKENVELKQSLDKMKLVVSDKKIAQGVRKKALNGSSSSSSGGGGSRDFEKWRSKERNEIAKPHVNHVGDVESELEKAIKAATS